MPSELEPIEVAYAALVEAGRPDLARWIHGWKCDQGFYLDYDGDDATGVDWALIYRAETLARQAIGLPPLAWGGAAITANVLGDQA